jgi:hypothetical protein
MKERKEQDKSKTSKERERKGLAKSKIRKYKRS